MPRTLLLVALGVAGCGGHAGGLPDASAVKRPASSHVVVIVMENEEAGAVLGTGRAPFADRLARAGGQATRSYAIRHPSLPNYLALTSGSTHGIASDCTSCHVRGASIADQLEAAHLSWRAYMEDLPRPCFAGAGAGRYAKKHDPFMYYDAIARRPARCRHVVGFDRLARDLRGGGLPAYAFISPNLCHDGHDCGVGVADRFLSKLVPPLRRALGPRGYLVLTWDEGSTGAGCCAGARGGRIATILVGPRVRPGARHTAPVDHYGVLGTIEDSLRLPRLGAARDPGHGSLRDLFTSAAPIR
jgi:hypothetical protein